ncbi:MAG: hypothetical protein KIT58_09335, partial [Planctomycetota bacterium]|nr:hypothetical protein [Planctomycetota bacterium]
RRPRPASHGPMLTGSSASDVLVVADESLPGRRRPTLTGSSASTVSSSTTPAPGERGSVFTGSSAWTASWSPTIAPGERRADGHGNLGACSLVVNDRALR